MLGIVGAAGEQLHRRLVAVLGAAVGALFDLDAQRRALVRRQIQPAVFLRHRAHKGLPRFGDRQDLAFQAAGHPRLFIQAHQHAVAGQRPRKPPGWDKYIRPSCILGGKPKAAAQFYKRAGQRLLRHAAFHRKISALFLADPALCQQFFHRPLHLFVVAQLFLQLF